MIETLANFGVFLCWVKLGLVLWGCEGRQLLSFIIFIPSNTVDLIVGTVKVLQITMSSLK
jgi:hypothetical protein